MTNALAPMSVSDMERLAVAISKSGMFGIKTVDQALTLMAISQAEGRHPALAARDYHMIGTAPSKKAEAMARDFFSAGGKIEWHQLSDEIVDATFSHPQGGTARISWDQARVKKAGLSGNHQKYPRQMLRSRVVSEGVRTVWPMATSGFYVPEEVSAFAEEREPIDVTPIKSPAADLDAFAAVDRDIYAEACAASERGMGPLEEFWHSLNKAQQKALKPEMDALKDRASLADEVASDNPIGLPPLEQASPHVAAERPGAEPAMHTEPGAGVAHTADSVGD